MKTPEDKIKILLVEDEPNLAFNLKLNLDQEGYEVIHASDGQEATELFNKHKNLDLIVLDVMLPHKDGYQVAEFIRGQNDIIQILMLTALGREEDRLKGFAAGVDDYMPKPFHLSEFLARIKRMSHKARYLGERIPTNTNVDEDNKLLFNYDDLSLVSANGTFELTALEAEILNEFLRNPHTVLSREYLLQTVWGIKGNVETRTVDAFITRLRKYIEPNPGQPVHLVSVRGRGYKYLENP